jgi:hypothetical protein
MSYQKPKLRKKRKNGKEDREAKMSTFISCPSGLNVRSKGKTDFKKHQKLNTKIAKNEKGNKNKNCVVLYFCKQKNIAFEQRKRQRVQPRWVFLRFE